MRRYCGFTAMILITVWAGCAPRPLESSLWPEARPLGRELETVRPDERAPRTSEVIPQSPSPAGTLALRDAMGAALIGSPELSRFGYDMRAAEVRVLQAGLWSNPELDLELENFAGSGDIDGTDQLELTLSIAQTFPLGGDISRRRELAQLEGRLAGWDYEAARVGLLAEVAQRFAELLAAQERIRLAEESAVLAKEIADSTARRVEAGDVPAVENSRAAVPLATARVQVGRVQRELESARVRLAMTWGEPAPNFGEARGDLTRLQTVPPLGELTQRIGDNPELARWTVEIASRQAEVELARAEATPDLTAGLGFRWFNESDDTALVAGVSLPLPIFDRRQGDILAARFGVASAQNQQRAIELRVTAALSAAYARLAGAYDEAVALRDHALPPAEAAYRDVRQAFDQGNLGYLDVIDAERTLVELRQQHLEALAEYHSAVAEIEGLTGQPLVTDTNSPPQLKTNTEVQP